MTKTSGSPPPAAAPLGPNDRGLAAVQDSVYDELHRVALRLMRASGPDSIYTPSVLVHEAWLKVGAGNKTWNGVEHFKAVSARAMRQILVDHARAGQALRHGGAHQRITLSSSVFEFEEPEFDLEALDRSLQALAGIDPRSARVVELRYFGGLTNQEVADYLDLSLRAVEADWAHARAWLCHEIKKRSGYAD